MCKCNDVNVYELPDSIRGVNKTHSSAGTAEEIIGTPPFTEGATIRISDGGAAPIFVGSTKIEAQAHKLGTDAVGLLTFRLQGNKTTFWVDTATSNNYQATQISIVK